MASVAGNLSVFINVYIRSTSSFGKVNGMDLGMSFVGRASSVTVVAIVVRVMLMIEEKEVEPERKKACWVIRPSS